jgi:TatD DNase family protein
MKGLIDSHAHLTYTDTQSNIESMLTKAKHAGVSKIINVCTDLKSLEIADKLVNRHNWIYNAAGISPHDVEKDMSEFYSYIEKYAKAKKIVAVGEIGLDYYYHKQSKDLQITLLKKQIELAIKFELPVIIHCREAFFDLFEVTSDYPPFRAVLHCFTGSIDEAKKVLEIGWNISFSGIVTFKNSTDLQQIAAQTPLERMLIETDSPFLAPQIHRGKKNEPAYVIEVAKEIALLKNIELEKVIATTAHNATDLFSLY